MNNSCARCRGGFTLIELMVTIAIAAILLVVAVPNFVQFQRNSELTSAANSLLASINTARGEAMKRGRAAVVVPNTSTGWSSGWTVFMDNNNDQQLNTGDLQISTQNALPTYFTTSGSGSAAATPGYLMFDASGYAKNSSANFQASTLTITRNDLSGADKADQTRIIVIARTGRVRVCKPASDATCTSSATE